MKIKQTRLECKLLTHPTVYEITKRTDTTLGFLDEGDAEEFKESLEEIKDLIETNPFYEKIAFLLKHRHLENKEVKNMHNEMRTPNCIGTALWINGKSKLNYPYHGYEECLAELLGWNELNNGYWKKEFSENQAIPGELVISCYDGDWHAGIYLGKVKNKHLTFCKQGSRHTPFGPASFRYYSRPIAYTI